MTSLFHFLVACHIVTGATGLVLFWAPVLTRKGSPWHRKLGRWFAYSMLLTGSLAIGMSACTLLWPIETHPTFTDAALVRGLFGWMMQYLGLLTISLAWHGLVTIERKRNHPAHRGWFSVALQVGVIVAALNCALQGFLIGQPLMMGIAVIGAASGITNLVFVFNRNPPRHAYLMEHVKSSVGAGISVYTAFLAFGLVRSMPEQVFNPAIWSVPTLIGVGLILYHQRRIAAQHAARLAKPGEATLAS